MDLCLITIPFAGIYAVRGMEFETENDTEVAAAFISHKLNEGSSPWRCNECNSNRFRRIFSLSFLALRMALVLCAILSLANQRLWPKQISMLLLVQNIAP